MTRTDGVRLITLALLSLVCLTEAGDTEIWPIPTECPKVDPLDHTVHLQHESDCTKFYKCDHGNKVLFDCPAGLHFNPVLQVCDWPYQAKCTLGQSSAKPESSSASPPAPSPTTSPKPPSPPADKDPDCPWPDPLDHTVHLPHESDCTKFYKCDNGKKVEFDCPDGLHFNKELEVCDWPRDAGCEEIPPDTTTAEPETPAPPEPTPPADKDPDCPWPDPLNYTVHLPHETDCTKFYKCDNGKKVEFDCPDGLHFNKELEVCDWPRDAGCEEIPPDTTTAEPETPAPPEPTPPVDKDPDCPWPDPLNYTVHLPHETDCTKFYKCDNGKKVEFDCPDGLHFNKELEVCDWPRDAGCEEIRPDTTTAEPETPAPPEPTPPVDKDPDCPWPDPLNYTVHLPHESDCTKFYKCDNGKKVEFDCPDGLHFNKELEVCDWPRDAGCEEIPPDTTTAEPETPAPPEPTPPADKDPDCPWPDPLNYTVHLPHETDCTKFYKCDNGKKVEFDCPDGLHFNKELEVCDWPRDAGCEEIPPDTTTAEPETPAPPEPTPPADKDPDCPWPDPLNYTVHLPHETDCTKFYKCDNGKKVEFDCPDGLHFNKELEVCDWPRDAGCEEIPPDTTTAEPETPASPEPTPPADKDSDCPWPDPLNYTVHLPHETDCTKFYKCDNGKKVEFDCPDGLHFNKELEVCDWPRDAGCEEIPPDTTTAEPETPAPPEPTPPVDKDPDCPWPDPLNYTVHLPHETDCTKFYKCDNGKKVEFDCPDGLHFNKELEVCDWPRDAGCEEIPPDTTTAEPETPTPPEPTPPADKDPDCPWPDPLNYTVHLPHETDCTKFYKCDNGKKVEFDCPDGLHFNKELEVCDWPRDAGCEEIPPDTTTAEPETPTPPEPTPPADKDPDCPWPDPLNYTVHLPHETDCTKFYKCDNGKKVEFDCPDGLHFNKELEVCDWPRDAGCEEIPPDTTTAEPETPAPPEPTPPADKDPDCPWPDPLNYTVHLPHETDCTKFYKCDNGKKVEFDCPDGLHFNKELEVCDWPGSAGCEETPLEPESTTPPTTALPVPTCSPNECQDSTIYLPVLSDPRKYIRCVWGEEVVETCPPNLVFDERLATCNLEDQVVPIYN